MRWQGRRQSQNIEDRRGSRVATGAKTGGIGGIIIILVAMYFGVDPQLIQNMVGGISSTTQTSQKHQPTPAEDRLSQFIAVVLADTEDTWHQLFKQMNKRYKEPKLVLFSGSVKSACGLGKAAMGPFYCPGDHKVYIDLSFYHDLKTRFKAPGDFAQAYVVAHEVGHHVQTLLGISKKAHAMRAKVDKVKANKISVLQELQADCFAGIWAHHAERTKQILETGDIEEALTAATSIGDDRLQKQSQGYVSPDSFTHGSSAQRVRWFKIGFQSGKLNQCNTFKAKQL